MSKPRSIPTDTNLITELDVATAALLAKRQGILYLNGIKSLTPDVARELGRIQGDGIFLRGLTSLSAEVAEELLPIAQKLGIGGPEFDEEQDDFSVAHLFGDELAPSWWTGVLAVDWRITPSLSTLVSARRLLPYLLRLRTTM